MSSLLKLSKRVIGRSTSAEKRVSVLGTMGSGKTTSLGLICLTCETLSSQWQNFKVRIIEKTSGIREAPSDLRQGHFPPKTVPGTYYEADVIMKWESNLGDKLIRLPFCETAGEDIQKLIGRFSEGMYNVSRDFHAAGEIHKYILSSNGFILVCPASRALMFSEGQSIEKEPTNLLRDPDVNLVRILSAIYDYKEKTRSPPIEGMAVLLTKYDLIQPYAQSMGLDLYRGGDISFSGCQQFMNNFFPQTSQQLKYYGMDKVVFFPSYVQVQLADKMGKTAKWSDGSDKIMMHPSRPRMPQYSESSYKMLVEWLRETFTK